MAPGNSLPLQPQRTHRSFDRRNIHTVLDELVAGLCADAGNAYFVGIQPQLVPQHPAMVIFTGPSGSSLALPIPGLTAEAIRAKVLVNEMLFDDARRAA